MPPQHSFMDKWKEKTRHHFAMNALVGSEASWQYHGNRYKRYHKIKYYITGEILSSTWYLNFQIIMTNSRRAGEWIFRIVVFRECSPRGRWAHAAPVTRCSTHQRRMPSASDLKRLPSLGFIGRRWLQSGSFSRALFIQLTNATFSSSENRKSR